MTSIKQLPIYVVAMLDYAWLRLSFCAADTAWIGAEYNGMVYQWKATAAAATLLQALNIDRSVGDCLVMSLNGLVAADCSSQHYVLCQKGEKASPVSLCCARKVRKHHWSLCDVP